MGFDHWAVFMDALDGHRDRIHGLFETILSPTQGDSRETGEVKWFNVSKGFGFIRRENGEEIFVHFRSLRGPNQDRRQLREGQKVSFVVGQSEKGPQAEQVETLHH